MHNNLYKHAKSFLLPCLAFSAAVGFISAFIITAFKIAAKEVIDLSTKIYASVRENPEWLPIMILGAAAIGLIASFILSRSRSCRGGGIPTSVAAIRGIVSFRWFASVFVLPFSALLSFLCGLPLGTEGPCVQMGTAIGDGVVKCFGSENQKGWRRYVMTGGASAGFSIATASPITAVLLSIEELHKHFSPMLLTVASISVVTSQITVQALSFIGIESVKLFEFSTLPSIDAKLIFVPLIVGVTCGVASILFTKLYHLVDNLMHRLLKKVPIVIVFPILFACVSVVGFFLADALGTGHSLVEVFTQSKIAWYLLITVFLIRAIGMMSSNTAGVSGGVFLPTLAFGAIIGALSAEVMTSLGWISSDHYILIVILGVTAFLGATSRIPITACVFAIEALGGINNILPLIIATTIALLIVETSGLEDFTDTIIAAKVRSINKDKKPTTVEASLTVSKNAFVVGKELRDVLWPNACVVVSFERAKENQGSVWIAEGDVITVHYTTYDAIATYEEIEELVGEQSEQIYRTLHPDIN